MNELEVKTKINKKERYKFTALGKRVKYWKIKNASLSLITPVTTNNIMSIMNFTYSKKNNLKFYYCLKYQN